MGNSVMWCILSALWKSTLKNFFLLFVLDPSSNNESDLGNNKVLGGIVYFNEDIDF